MPTSPKPPSHIVLFKPEVDPGEAIQREFEVLPGIEVETADRGRVRTLRRAAGPESDTDIRIYQRIGAAALRLSAAEASALEEADDVESVFPNELRSIQPPRHARSATSATDGEGDSNDGDEGDRADDWTVSERAKGPGPAAAGGFVDDQHFTWGLKRIGCDREPLLGGGVRVAVLDTGLDLDHPDITIADAADLRSFVGTATVNDGHGHGTHCCGTVAGAQSPVAGPRYGVAPEARLIVGKVLDDRGRGYDDGILDGIDWAASARNAAIISMSLGSVRREGEPHSTFYEEIAERLLDQGCVLIAAAGNESRRPHSRAPIGNPAACPSILSVGATSFTDAIAWFSCAALDDVADLNLVAPGVDVRSAWIGGGYSLSSGTSMATPHVAGVAALFAQATGRSGRDLVRTVVSGVEPMPQIAPEDGGAGMLRVPAIGLPQAPAS